MMIANALPAPAVALASRFFRDGRTRTLSFAYIFAAYSWLQAAGFRNAYPTLADRVAFVRAFAGNAAIRLFYGYPYHVVTTGGYTAWRVGGTLAVAGGGFGLLAAVRALRAEEEAGRAEIVLATAVGRRTVLAGALAAIGASITVLWAAEFVGCAAAGLPAAGSAYLALGTASVMAVFAGVGALASQLAATRHGALAVSGAALAAMWLLRVLSDTVAGAAWVRWATPLGWAEQLQPFARSDPAFLLLLAPAAAVLLVGTFVMSSRRDVGTGLLPVRNTARPVTWMLGSIEAHTLRRQLVSLTAWALVTVTCAAVFGTIATSVSAAGIPKSLQTEIGKLGSGSILDPAGYLALVFMVFILAICLFVCAQVNSAWEEETGHRLETVLSQPVGRFRWLAGRMAAAELAAVLLAGLAGLGAWAGASSQGVHISLVKMLEAAANCLPISLLVLGLSALAYTCLPRATTTVGYALVGVAFIWYLVGSLLGAPGWVTAITPFNHIGLVPAQQFRLTAAIGMSMMGMAAALAALVVFRRRDLISGGA